jgi:hypothetical protein
MSTTNKKKELLPVYNKETIITSLKHATKKSYYFSKTNNKKELLPV